MKGIPLIISVKSEIDPIDPIVPGRSKKMVGNLSDCQPVPEYIFCAWSCFLNINKCSSLRSPVLNEQVRTANVSAKALRVHTKSSGPERPLQRSLRSLRCGLKALWHNRQKVQTHKLLFVLYWPIKTQNKTAKSLHQKQQQYKHDTQARQQPITSQQSWYKAQRNAKARKKLTQWTGNQWTYDQKNTAA